MQHRVLLGVFALPGKIVIFPVMRTHPLTSFDSSQVDWRFSFCSMQFDLIIMQHRVLLTSFDFSQVDWHFSFCSMQFDLIIMQHRVLLTSFDSSQVDWRFCFCSMRCCLLPFIDLHQRVNLIRRRRHHRRRHHRH